MAKTLTADILIKNGQVLTVNANDDIVEAVAIKGNKIIAVGSNDDLADLVDENTQIIDAEAKTVVPGFIDTHMHFLMYGMLDKGVINIAYPKVKSIVEIKE